MAGQTPPLFCDRANFSTPLQWRQTCGPVRTSTGTKMAWCPDMWTSKDLNKDLILEPSWSFSKVGKMSSVRAVSLVMLASMIVAENMPPATVGEKLAFLVETMGLQGARRGGLGWPWASASIPPDSFYDCLYLYFSCTDHHPPGILGTCFRCSCQRDFVKASLS